MGSRRLTAGSWVWYLWVVEDFVMGSGVSVSSRGLTMGSGYLWVGGDLPWNLGYLWLVEVLLCLV